MERILTNLLVNAIKYSPDRGRIQVCIKEEGDDAILAVSDQGLGIPDEDRDRIFERFHRGANVVGRIPGTGVGLAAVRALVREHGGTISVDSEFGAFTEFTVRLPRRSHGATTGRAA